MLHAIVGVVLAAQAQAASLVGVVRDRATGEPLPGVVVTLPDLGRELITDAYGRYLARGVPAGPQHVSFQRIGYARRALHALVPEAGELEIDVALTSQPIPLARVDIRPRVPLRGAEEVDSSAAADRSISIAAIRNHPLLAEPDAFLALRGGGVNVKPEAPAGVHVRGGAADQTAWVLDGIPVFHPFHASGAFAAWNPDALSRLDVFASSPPVIHPDALSGVIAATTRQPATRFQAQGSVSTMQARLTADGPLGTRGAGYMLSLRSAFPGLFAPTSDPSYTRSETADWLAKVEAPVFGGWFRLLGFQSEDEIDASATVDASDGTVPAPRRNLFEWQSRSFGMTWSRTLSEMTLTLQSWSAFGDAAAHWSGAHGGTEALDAGRNDSGILAAIQHSRDGRVSVAGFRIAASRTSYSLKPDTAVVPLWSAESSSPVISAFAEHTRPLSRSAQLGAALSIAHYEGQLYASPRARLRWMPASSIALNFSLARLHQFTQSLRNPESIVGTIFPVDLSIGAGARGIPVAASNQAGLAIEYRPLSGLKLGAEAFARELHSVVLVAPRDGEPFVTREFASGSGSAFGAALDASYSTAHFGILGSYGWQRVRLAWGDSAYVPDHGAAHTLDAGIIVFPAATTSIRIGAVSQFGRRTTNLPGALEWEACNLLDRGCEFSGSPHYGNAPLGEVSLPPYFRLDLGLRHHWHLQPAGRDVTIALFGTITNVFGRRNVLAYAADPVLGTRVPIEMLSRGPFVLGLDWRF